jgi:hypothetical protein
MSVKEYMSEILKYPKRNAEMGRVAQLILNWFPDSPYYSAYQIYNIFKLKDEPMAYKNVHKRMQKLRCLNFIEEVKMESKHGAKYYKLTTAGIYRLLTNSEAMSYSKSQFFKNYGNNIIFRTFLYPYFERETFLQIHHAASFGEVSSYLSKCCQEMETILSHSSDDSDLEFPLFNWNKVPGEDNEDLLYLMKELFGFKWTSKENVKIEKSINKDTLKILSSKSSIFIRLDEEKNRAIMTTDDGRTFEFTVESTNEGLDIGFDFPVADWTRLYLWYHLGPLITNLAFFLIRSTSNTGIHDAKVLSQDKRFMRLLKQTKEEFLNYYQQFIELSKVRDNSR